MYLGHPTDNVQIESLKKCDAWKQSVSMTTVKLFSVLIVTKSIMQPRCQCNGTFILSVTLIGCLIISCCTHGICRRWGAGHRFIVTAPFFETPYSTCLDSSETHVDHIQHLEWCVTTLFFLHLWLLLASRYIDDALLVCESIRYASDSLSHVP